MEINFSQHYSTIMEQITMSQFIVTYSYYCSRTESIKEKRKDICAFNKVFIRACDLTAPKYIIFNISNLRHIQCCLINFALEFTIVSDCHLLDACILH